MVTVSGTISFPNYRKGNIGVYWSFNADTPPMQPVFFKKPGNFSIRVPKNIGKVYISATIYLPGENFPIALSNDIPVDVGSKNLTIHGLEMENCKTCLMHTYRGPIVNIKGKVLINNYKGGSVNVVVHSEENYRNSKRILLPPDIAVKVLSCTGDYCIEVPRKIGKVYLLAIYIPPGPGERDGDQPGRVVGKYNGNPLFVADSDIKKADIVINIPAS